MSQADAVFVGRINTNRKMKVVRSLIKEDDNRYLGKMALVDDVIVHLYGKDHKEDTQEFRVVKARFKKHTNTARKSPKGSNRKKTEQEVFFITNVTNEPGQLQLTPQEVAETYRLRWALRCSIVSSSRTSASHTSCPQARTASRSYYT